MVSRYPPHLAARLLTALLALVVVSGCAIVPAGLPLDVIRGAGLATPIVTASSAPDGTPAPAISATAVRPAPRAGRFSMDLYRRSDHVPQFNVSWCVGASMQMMINIIDAGRPDRTRSTQQQLYKLARKVSPWMETAPGASVYGWAEGLEQLGYGPYDELAADSRQAALKLAARQMRATDKPVGLLVWAGAHAWVMSGFKATADPALTDDFTVTHVWIEDPWTGRTSGLWGPGLDPHTLMTAKELGADYVRYASVYRPQYGRDGRFVVVAPVEELSAPV